MGRKLLALAAAVSTLAIIPAASAAVIVNGSSNVAPTVGVPAGQGTVQATQSSSVQAETFSANFLSAVYLNTLGTLDFYYEVFRTGPGSVSSLGEISGFSVANFTGFTVDGFATGATDPDGAGPFQGGANPFLADGTTPSGSTTSFGRSFLGDTVQTNFGLNGLSGTERSTTYIFRTNATAFNNLGTFGINGGGSAAQGFTFQPTSAVPEPATWAMMLAGFGIVGGAMRRRAKIKQKVRFALS